MPRGPAPWPDRRRGSTASTLAGRSSRLDCLPSPPSDPGGLPRSMARRSDIGTAVIGSGFIGTVHIEALRRIGVNVVGLLGSTGPRRRPGVPGRLGARLRLARRAAGRRPRPGRPRHVAQRAPRPAGQGDPRRGPARRVREAARDDAPPSPASSSGSPRASGLVNAVNFNIRFYPLNQHVSAVHPRRRRRRRPAGHRPLLPGLAALRHRLELAARARAGRRAARGRRHRRPTGST